MKKPQINEASSLADRREMQYICACSGHGQILTLLNTSVQEPVRCTVSLCGQSGPAHQIKPPERNNNNYHRLDRRENEFYDAVRGVDRQPGGKRCSIIR